MEQFIADYGYWALVSGLLLENTIVVGTFFPGTTLTFIAAFSAGLGSLNIFITAIITFSVLIFADNISFAAGRWLVPKIPKLQSYISRHQSTLTAERSFTFAMLPYQFISTVKALLPLAAGGSSVTFRAWLTFNIAASLIFTAVMSASGYFAGRLIGDLAGTGVIFVWLQAITVIAIVGSVSYGIHKQRSK